MIARYTWRVSLVGLSLLSLSAKLLHLMMWAPETGIAKAVGGGSATMVDGPPGILPATLLAAVIGIAWIAQGLTRAQALRIDADGSVQGLQDKAVCVRLTQVDGSTLEAAQRMLLRLGIGSTIYRNRRPAKRHGKSRMNRPRWRG